MFAVTCVKQRGHRQKLSLVFHIQVGYQTRIAVANPGATLERAVFAW